MKVLSPKEYYKPPAGTYLEEEKSVAFRREVGLALGLVRPVDDEGSETAETGVDFL